MLEVVLILVFLALAVLVGVIVADRRGGTGRSRRRRDGASEAERERFRLEETGDRIPLAERLGDAQPIAMDDADEGAWESGTGLTRPGLDDSVASWLLEEEQYSGRVVQTPDGERFLAPPPFTLKRSVLAGNERGYAAALTRWLLPGTVLLCKVRMDAVLMPTAPDGIDADDWRTWRKRVRLRALDFVICETGSWRPLVAVMLPRAGEEAMRIGGGRDRVIEEVLAEVGLPLVTATGEAKADRAAVTARLKEGLSGSEVG